MIPVELAKTPELSRLKENITLLRLVTGVKREINQRNNFVYGRHKESA